MTYKVKPKKLKKVYSAHGNTFKYKVISTNKGVQNIRFFTERHYAIRYKNLLKSQAEIFKQKPRIKLEKL